ncbi:MAG: nucleotidyltransferase family protein [Gemmatimonadales bacterium]
MPLTRVTITLSPDLVAAADRVARRRKASRSAVLAEALRRHLAESNQAGPPGRVAESVRTAYTSLSDEALLAELGLRLHAHTAADAGGESRPSDGPRLRYDRAEIAALCRRHRIARLSLFGSVLTDAFGPDSDVDVLVAFEPGHTPGLAMTDVEDELSALFGGRRVDVVTERSLHRLIRDRVLASAVVQFAA